MGDTLSRNYLCFGRSANEVCCINPKISNFSGEAKLGDLISRIPECIMRTYKGNQVQILMPSVNFISKTEIASLTLGGGR